MKISEVLKLGIELSTYRFLSTVTAISMYKNNIRKKDIKGLLKFMETFLAEKGVVVTKDREGEELVDGNWIVFVPLWKWLMWGRKSS